MLKEEVGPDDIAEVVEAWTGIPAGRMLERRDRQATAPWRSELGKRVIGQRGRKLTVVQRGPPQPGRVWPTPLTGPWARSCSWAPTGVGKTELAKSLAEFLLDDERAMVRHRHERVRREALGGPPGAVRLPATSATTRAVA